MDALNIAEYENYHELATNGITSPQNRKILVTNEHWLPRIHSIYKNPIVIRISIQLKTTEYVKDIFFIN